MGWFSKKQEKSTDDALVERTLAFAQAVAQEEPEDEQALLALIDGVRLMPTKPLPDIDAPVQPDAISPALPSPMLPPVSFSRFVDEMAPPRPLSIEPLPVLAMTKPASPERVLPQPVSRSGPAVPASTPKQSEMRREIAQRVQNFKAHQQRLNDEREARIKKIYADMQTHLQKSGAQKSSSIS